MPAGANTFSLRVVVAYHSLPKIGRAWRDGMADLSERTAADIAETARQLAPLGDRTYTDQFGEAHPGWLKDSIVFHRAPGRRLQWMVEVLAPYGWPVNYGYREWKSGTWVPPQPFWEPAIEQHITGYKENVGSLLDGMARSAARKRTQLGQVIGPDGRFTGQFVGRSQS